MIDSVRFYVLSETEAEGVRCRCKRPAVWLVETRFIRDSPYVTQRPHLCRRYRKVCQLCRERIEGGAP